ncbi:MAG: UvrD-helicase domain-containing protein [Candidatus Marinimicrobia bacterium]|jgi:DNA helicase-4|nr:UvrD-helicase domain-containing protein [Candidatus Neomarinimicrobiota bacterium]
MNAIIKLLITAVLIFSGVLYYRWNKKKNRKKKELFEFFKSKLDTISKAKKEFSNHLEYNTGYFSNNQLSVWLDKFNLLYLDIKDKKYENIHLEKTEILIVKQFLQYYIESSSLRLLYNKNFIKEELEIYKIFFNNIEGKKLDTQQRTSIISNEDNNLVVAGAGSGKTTTIVGKINYLIDRYDTKPNDILLISFTKKSADELASRINLKGLKAKTFHKFGIDVISSIEKKQPSIFDEKQFKPFIIRTFKELLKDENYIIKVIQYFTDFSKPIKQQDEFDNQGEYFQYLKDNNFKSYQQKEKPVNGKVTYKMEVVKSIEECQIANFLFFNNINYEYELPYEHDTATQAFRQYKPDFTINPKGDRVYLEHFAKNKNGTVPEWFADESKGESQEDATRKYNDGIKWKRKIHKKYSTTLLESYSYEMYDGTLFDNLTEKMLQIGITLKPKTPQEKWKIISEVTSDEVDNIISLFQTFITLMKANNYKISDVKEKNSAEVSDTFQKQRNALFIEIIQPIFESYEKLLTERNEIDFSDMINKASNYISRGKYKNKFSYVIIDEFQDISIGRYQLVKAIKTNNPVCKLFAVGDDWQSIYRFSGSDIALFKEFENYFGCTIKSKIESTYRFHDPLIHLSSKFILKNPNQEKKELKGTTLSKSTEYKIIYSNSDNQDDSLALKEVFDKLILNEKNIEKKKIIILGRYSFDIDRIKNEQYFFKINNSTGKISYKVKTDKGTEINITSQFLTVHRAKGLEADIVIIINCNSGKFGFPSEISDDTVLILLLSEADQFENGEERRLFYVAMTRAKENVIFIADSLYKSKFITELELESDNNSIKKCPRCKIADLKLKSGTKNGEKWEFYGCSNYIYGCDYKEWL